METTLQPEGQHEEMLTINQAAEFLNVKISKLRKEVFYGRIKHYKFGALVRFKKTHLIEWIESQFRDVRSQVSHYQIQ